jgi:hypothetical protein
MANANVSRSHPRSAESGAVNRPKLVRVPKVTMAIAHPATMTTVGLRHHGLACIEPPYHERFND